MVGNERLLKVGYLGSGNSHRWAWDVTEQRAVKPLAWGSVGADEVERGIEGLRLRWPHGEGASGDDAQSPEAERACGRGRITGLGQWCHGVALACPQVLAAMAEDGGSEESRGVVERVRSSVVVDKRERWRGSGLLGLL